MYFISVRITFVRLTSYYIDVKPAKFPLSHSSRSEGKVKHESINFGVFFIGIQINVNGWSVVTW